MPNALIICLTTVYVVYVIKKRLESFIFADRNIATFIAKYINFTMKIIIDYRLTKFIRCLKHLTVMRLSITLISTATTCRIMHDLLGRRRHSDWIAQ